MPKNSMPLHLCLLTVEEVADILGLSTRTVYDWIRAGLLPAKRLGPTGRLIRVSRAELETFIDTNFQEEGQ